MITDTKFATQVDWQISDRFSATAQLISKQYENKQWTPRFEWAFVKFNATNSLDIRAGRIRPPVYMLSDYLDVNYANPWVRPPVELYYALPITNMDGIDLLWRPKLGSHTFLVQPYYGKKSLKAAGGGTIEAESKGLSISGSSGDFSYRVGYYDSTNEFDTSSLAGAIQGLGIFCSFGDSQACSAQANLDSPDFSYSFTSVGATWDNGDYFVSGEVGQSDSGTLLVSSADSWYITAGKRVANLTPYFTYADFSSKSPASVSSSPFPVTNQILTGIAHGTAQDQHTFTAGLRIDVLSNVSLKVQWDHIETECKNNTPGTCKGLFMNESALFNMQGNSVDLFSLSADFIF